MPKSTSGLVARIASDRLTKNPETPSNQSCLSTDSPPFGGPPKFPRDRDLRRGTKILAGLKSGFSEPIPIALDDGGHTITSSSSGETSPNESSTAVYFTSRKQDLVNNSHNSHKFYLQARDYKLQDSRSSLDSRMTDCSFDSSYNPSTIATTPSVRTPRTSFASSFSRRAKRRSHMEAENSSDSSRSSSPHKGPDNKSFGGHPGLDKGSQQQEEHNSPRRSRALRQSFARPFSSRKSDVSTAPTTSAQPPTSPRRKPTLMSRRSYSRPRRRNDPSPGEDAPRTQNNAKVSYLSGLPKSLSTERLPLKAAEDIPDVPSLVVGDQSLGIGLSVPKKRDPLWSAFRDLDSNYTKFASKSLASKTNVVRSSLLPFLQDHAKHEANVTSRAEDLNYRANILNRWWKGLIEMLHGRNQQSVAGTDRLVVLEALLGIMERPEWRQMSYLDISLPRRPPEVATRQAPRAATATLNQANLLADSVQKNVRNIFVQNLTAQVVLAVDKLSTRNAPASLVTFCGKACAYAFFFVPGMADVLVRLWDLPIDAIRRVLQESGIGKFDNITDLAPKIVGRFPPSLHHLGFTSLAKCMRTLRTPPSLPHGTFGVNWWGPWLERWSGRESEMFYAFVKQYHILLTDFLPDGLSKKERVCSPAFVLIQAQILTNLDAVIHRKVPPGQVDLVNGNNSTPDDVLAVPDAIAATVPLPPINATRVMAENRLIMLIRDFLSERTPQHPIARKVFAESFVEVLHCAVRGTSIFDQAACHTLLDFAEEALPLLVRYERLKESDQPLIDAEFWRTVSMKMLSGHNNGTELRLYAFLYSIWGSIACNTSRKNELCLGFLLDEEFFESRFSHWCPMIRAYFMRLLCWRVARCDMDISADDTHILDTLQSRLKTVWSYYLYQGQHVDRQHTFSPDDAPCNPAPGRRLVILRTDAQALRKNTLVSFDSQSKMPGDETALAINKRMSTLSLLTEDDLRPNSSRSTSDESETSPRTTTYSVGGLFRSLMGSKARPRSTIPITPLTRPPSNHPGQAVRSATDDMHTTHNSTSFTRPIRDTKPAVNRNFSFKFSLELQTSSPGGIAPQEIKSQHRRPPIRLNPPHLPFPAQQVIRQRAANTSTREPEPVHARAPTSSNAKYIGRALAEWQLVLNECQFFFERRIAEGVADMAAVETPMLGVEVLRRPV